MVYSAFGLTMSQTNVMLGSVYICRLYSSNSSSINKLICEKQPVVFKALKLPYINSPLSISKKRSVPQRQHRLKVERQISHNANWTTTWPVARTFQPDLVKIPLYMGYTESGVVKYKRDSSIELLKLPNFLHLAPPAIKKHCAAINKFCTQWPKQLKSESDCNTHFPLQVVTSDYCFSSPSIREPLARIVTLRVKLGDLKLDAHAKDKFLRLVGDRYDPSTDILSIVTDHCPSRQQNLDYAKFLLTAVYYESQNTEPWEAEKSVEDMEYFDWDKSESRTTLTKLHYWPKKSEGDLDYTTIPVATEYKKAVSNLVNEGDSKTTLGSYKESVLRLVGLKQSA